MALVAIVAGIYAGYRWTATEQFQRTSVAAHAVSQLPPNCRSRQPPTAPSAPRAPAAAPESTPCRVSHPVDGLRPYAPTAQRDADPRGRKTARATQARAPICHRTAICWNSACLRPNAGWQAAQAVPSVFSSSGSNDPALLRRYFETLSKYIEIEKVFVYRTVANQQPSMTVLYGAFDSRVDAVKSLEALPDELKVNRPYIRTVQGMRTEIGLKKPS